MPDGNWNKLLFCGVLRTQERDRGLEPPTLQVYYKDRKLTYTIFEGLAGYTFAFLKLQGQEKSRSVCRLFTRLLHVATHLLRHVTPPVSPGQPQATAGAVLLLVALTG